MRFSILDNLFWSECGATIRSLHLRADDSFCEGSANGFAKGMEVSQCGRELVLIGCLPITLLLEGSAPSKMRCCSG